MLNVGICDDSPMDIEILSSFISSFTIDNNFYFKIHKFSSGAALIDAHAKRHMDVIFLDIEMPGRSGMDIAKQLRMDGNDDVLIIFVTSYPEYMQDSFDVQPFHFLSKPLTMDRVSNVLSLIMKRYNHSHVTRLIADDHGQKRLVTINNIIYMQTLKGEKNCLRYVLVDGYFTGHGTIQEWEDELKNNNFICPCRGFLVNIKHIATFGRNEITMNNGEIIPISRRKLTQLQSLFANRIINILK